jgi:hypothetical protein
VFKKIKAMKLKMISFSVLFVVIFLSCKKEKLSVTGNTEVMFLSNVMMNDQPYYQYVYNDSNLVSEESNKFEFTMHHYNAKNQLVSSDYYWNNAILSTDVKMIETTLSQSDLITSVNGSKGGTIKYDYNSENQLTKATYSRPTSTGSEYSVFSYDESNRIDRQDLYWNNIATGYVEYSYDSKGNLIKEILYDKPSSGVAELSTTTQYVFDNKQNPYRSFKSLVIPGINTNLNNIIKEICTVHQNNGQGPDKVQITENSYEYNINGYPVSKNGNISYIYE